MTGAGPVVAVAGPPGAGKSTLAEGLVRRIPGAVLVEWDAYETFTRQPPEAVAAWLAAGAPIEAVEAPGLPQRLRAAAARGPVVFEAPFGRWHPETGPLIDLLVWLDVAPDLALARKLSQIVAGAHGPDLPVFLRAYLEAYARIVRPALVVQRERVRPGAELMLCADRERGSLVETVLERLPEVVRARP